MERRTLRRIAAATAGTILLGAVLATRTFMREPPPARSAPPDVNAAPDTRIRVEVLNATATRGLARRATMQLRDGGFDVVQIGTASEQRDSTLVLDRTGHPEWARKVADALGAEGRGARVESRPDPSRYLDVTVLLGRSWRPPAHALYP
ncbi:MAG TPA: LytR C-terminal domain-containing protein [Gemmatimonadaceae bacterium]|nr:LytR C-terminal domain-containing protein [Gemmatimonadaceae bacterium]